MAKLTYDAVISLGCRCDTAFQIRNYFGIDRAYFFDWLISPLSSVINLLDNDFSDVCLRENLEIIPAPVSGPTVETVIDKKYGYALHHEFSRTPEGRISAAFEEEFAKANSKLLFLSQRLNWILSNRGRVLFVRRGGDFDIRDEIPYKNDDSCILRLNSSLRRKAPNLDFDLLALNAPQPNQGQIPENIHFRSLHGPKAGEWSDPAHNWKGSTISYSESFDSIVRGMTG